MSSTDLFDSWASAAELWWTRAGGLPLAEPRRRLDLLVRYARENSPFYRAHLANVAEGAPLAGLPPVTRQRLMSRFDDWSTDRRVTRHAAEVFLADRRRIGARFLDRYWIWKSSGTNGYPGVYVQDAQSMAVYDALVAAQLGEAPWPATAGIRALAAGARAALMVADGDHFASIASWERMRRTHPAIDRRSFSVLEPLARLVSKLNEFQPGMLAGYPSALGLLAEERIRGRLAIAPLLIWSGGEHLAPSQRAVIENAFGAPVMNEYGASECLSIAHECREGWMHLHEEWVVLEGVDRAGNPTPPGELSHDTLLTNLANWVQPVIRYQLGDRIVRASGACRCGSRLPAFRLEGRTEEPLAMRTARGKAVHLLPLALTTVVEEVAGAHRFQIAKVGPSQLALRFEASGGSAPSRSVRVKAAEALKAHLAAQSLANVRLVQDPAPPRIDRASGKLKSVVVELA